MDRPIVWYRLGTERPITPQEPLPPAPDVPRGSIVVLEGRTAIWRYGMAFHRLHGSPAAAIAVYDPRLGAVIVASHVPDVSAADVLDIAAPE